MEVSLLVWWYTMKPFHLLSLVVADGTVPACLVVHDETIPSPLAGGGRWYCPRQSEGIRWYLSLLFALVVLDCTVQPVWW